MYTDEKGYFELRIAIIEQANRDYRNALKQNNKRQIAKLEKFYLSPWGVFITNDNGENIISRIRRETNNTVRL